MLSSAQLFNNMNHHIRAATLVFCRDYLKFKQNILFSVRSKHLFSTTRENNQLVKHWQHKLSDVSCSRMFSGINIECRTVDLDQNVCLLRLRCCHTNRACPSSPNVAVDSSGKYLEVHVNESTLKVPFVWLRDHCRSQRYYNHRTNQKNVDPDLLRRDLVPAAVEMSADKSSLAVTWRDGHVTEFTLQFLVNNFYPCSQTTWTQPVPWDVVSLDCQTLPTVSFQDHMSTQEGVKQTLQNLVKFGFTFVEGGQATLKGTQEVVERVAPVYKTLFGGMWTFSSDAARADTAYTSESLGVHTDTTYLSSPAGIQVFQCLEHSGSGGETILVDGLKAALTLRSSDPAAFETLASTVVPHEYIEKASSSSPGYHLYSLATVISTHPVSHQPVHIRFNPYDRAPLSTVKPEQIETFYAAYDSLARTVSDPRYQLKVKLQPGLVCFIDNWRVLHGRAGFDGRRIMCGCYLSRDDWTSRARLLGVL